MLFSFLFEVSFLWILFDFNHDGNLNKEEANWAFMALGYTFSEEELNSILSQYGKNGI